MRRERGEISLWLHGNGFWYYEGRAGRNRRVRLSTRKRDFAEAQEIARGIEESIKGHHPDRWREFCVPSDAELLAYLAKSRERAMRRDRERGRETSLTADDLRALFARSGGRCEVTGLPFSLAKADGTFRRPFAPSIDRLDTKLGYTMANCRLIALAANIAINEWGEAVFRRIALGCVSSSVAVGHSLRS